MDLVSASYNYSYIVWNFTMQYLFFKFPEMALIIAKRYIATYEVAIYRFGNRTWSA